HVGGIVGVLHWGRLDWGRLVGVCPHASSISGISGISSIRGRHHRNGVGCALAAIERRRRSDGIICRRGADLISIPSSVGLTSIAGRIGYYRIAGVAFGIRIGAGR